MSDKIAYLSQDGLEKLKVELAHLKTVRRKELAERLTAAKALGDLSENAEYHDAKEELGMVEGRIQQINDIMKNVSIIQDEKGADGPVRIGSTLTVEVRGKTKTYKVVGSNEANPLEGLISNESPLGNAFLGRLKGETFDIETPTGTASYTIVSIV